MFVIVSNLISSKKKRLCNYKTEISRSKSIYSSEQTTTKREDLADVGAFEPNCSVKTHNHTHAVDSINLDGGIKVKADETAS